MRNIISAYGYQTF